MNDMKGIIGFTILLMTILACSENREQARSATIKLDGFWQRSFSDYDFHESIQNMNCLDPEAMALYDPCALGAYFFIEGDRISLFRYPYQYYGTFEYKMVRDSLFFKSDFIIADQFLIQKISKDSLLLNFKEEVTSGCLINATANYEPFTPDTVIINKLIKDSVSYNSLIGEWWYLRKEIGYEDGSEPTILKYPKGMPDSLFLSEEIINRNVKHPFVELKLNNRMVKLFVEYPKKYSYHLRPELEENKKLFHWLIDYGDYIDTICYDVIYQKYR